MTDELPQTNPLVSFAVFSYNQEKYVRLAVEAALAQDYSPLEIILSDDCSSDGTFEVMRELAAHYSGPHRIRLNRNEVNLGVADHVNHVAGICEGELIVVAAGDDISKPERTSRISARWLAEGAQTMVLYSDFSAISVDGHPVSIPSETIYRGDLSLKMMAQGDIHVLGATMALSTNLFREFPPMHKDVRHEDRVLPFRALLSGGKVLLVDEKLIDYRIHGGVSRGDKSSSELLVREFIPNYLAKTLPDAQQRLDDAKASKPSDPLLVQECLRTIAHQQAVLALAGARGLGLEAALCMWLLKDAKPLLLLKYYAKLRFPAVYSAYFKRAQNSEAGNGA